MKTVRFLTLCLVLLIAGNTMAQTTEGKDFWVTFLQADQDDNNSLTLSLSISSRNNCVVTIANPFTGYSENVTVTANQMQLVEIYQNGSVLAGNARSQMQTTGKVCYAVNSEVVDTCALHITSTEDIALFATNYKKATFDATNVIPTTSLLDKYMVQTYTPSDHDGVSATQGSHFAIIAAEDNTVVDYYPTVATKAVNDAIYADSQGYILTPEQMALLNFKPGDKLTTPVLKKGEVFYVWTGKKDNAAGDLSGTRVEARDGKHIAVFQGCPHTNIPYQKKQRDHIFSQAMPTQYWGNTFAITASKNRKRDIIRVMALNDGTEVRINGNLVHTFNFSQDTKQYWEFEIGEPYGDLNPPQVNGTSCMLTTSCPCAVHLFIVSQQYDGDKNNNGDPAMLWINPIEQQIDQITFATYDSDNGTTNHYTNIVTNDPSSMTLDGADISADFTLVNGSSAYYFAQKSLGTVAGSHTLSSSTGNFIAHVYGFTANESYGYSAGGATVPLEQYIMINGERFSPSSQNVLCGKDTIHFKCDANYNLTSVTWIFGDGQTAVGDSVDHYYANTAVYQAFAIIERESSNLCYGQTAIDTIPITVNIGKLELTILDTIDDICANRKMTLQYNNTGTAISKNNCTYSFNEKATMNGFTQNDLSFASNAFVLTVPEGAEEGDDYSFTIEINTGCGDTTMVIGFSVPFDPNKLIARRWDDILAVYNSERTGYNFVSYQWYKNGEPMEGETGPTLSLDQVDFANEYFVCMTTDKNTQVCTCPTKYYHLDNVGDELEWRNNITVSALSVNAGGWIYVNAEEDGTAITYDVRGNKVDEKSFTKADGGVQIFFHESGLYIVDVRAGKMKQNFKIFVY